MRAALAFLLPLLLAARGAWACELCGGLDADFTALQERLARAPIAVLATPVGRNREGEMQFRVDEVLRGDARVQVGARVSPRGRYAALPGHAWLLLGREPELSSARVMMLRPATLAFLRAAPRLPPEDRPTERLLALIPWLAHEDPMVAASARQAFAAAPYASVRAAGHEVAPDVLVETLCDPARAPASRGALFLLLGQAGGPAHRKLLSTWMDDPAARRAPGFDALLAAWLLLTGAEGLPRLDALLAAPGGSETALRAAVLRALGFLAREEDRLPRDLLRARVRVLGGEPALAETFVQEARRLEAWDWLDAVLAHAEREGAHPGVRAAVTAYLRAHPGPEAKAALTRIEAR